MGEIAKTFGKRGLKEKTVAAAAVPIEVARGGAAVVFGQPMIEKSAGPWLPIVTPALIVFLIVIYILERSFAFEIGQDDAPNLLSIEAMGGASYNFIVAQGQWWRIFLAPLLHSTFSHLFGNCASLLFAGMVLEKTVGRAWLGAVFALGALGAMAGSLLGNAHGVMTLGASGAILSVVGALLVVSFLPRADPREQQSMRRVSVFIAMSAIFSLIFGALRSSSPVDNFAHLGGALTGAAVGLFICLTWPAQRRQAAFAGLATVLAIAGLGAAAVACNAAIAHFPVYAGRAAQFIPLAEVPRNLNVGDAKSADFVSRYPVDPRSHIMRGLAFSNARDLLDANREFSKAWGLAILIPDRRDARDLARSLLAVTMAAQGRRDAAKTFAADICKATFERENRRILDGAKLCS